MKITKPNFKNIREKLKSFRIKEIIHAIKTYEYDNFLLLYIILPVVLNFIITCLELKSPFKGIAYLFKNPYAFIVNTLIILLTLCITLLVRKRVFWISFISCVWLIFGISNFVLLCNRVTPFTFCDLFLIESLPEVLRKYFNWFQIVLLGLIVLAALVGLFMLFFHAPKLKRKIPYVRCLIVIAIISGLTVGSVKLGTHLNIMDAQFAELSAAYRKNGFAYCFTNSLIDNGVSRPKNYSSESIAQLVANDNSGVSGDTADQTPNIVIVQLESFFDISSLEGIEFSSDVIPNFHKYQAEGGGLFSVPVVGAGTVNSEFEVITGMTIDDFGAGEYPYKTILLDTTCESLAYNLKTYGYKTHVMHNNTGTFYSRNIVYSNLGFDNFMSVEYMKNVEKTPMGWAKDAILTDYIMDCLEGSEEQDLVYTISVQGHGTYNVEDGYEKYVTVTKCPEGKENYKMQYEYYANMIYEMDMFVQDLINTLNTYPEDTILVMYGDHLPSLDIESDDLVGRDMYQTDYFVWSNMGMEFDYGDISANEISSLIQKELGMSNGVINAFHQNHSEDEDFNKSLAALEYDILYGDKLVYGGTNPYQATDMKLGLEEVEIYNVIPSETNDNTFIIIGNNFTSYSRVFVNEERQKSKFVDNNTLIMTLDKDSSLNLGDVVNVWQSSLSATDDYIYNLVPMIKQEPETVEP